jgi:hypothetical protein
MTDGTGQFHTYLLPTDLIASHQVARWGDCGARRHQSTGKVGWSGEPLSTSRAGTMPTTTPSRAQEPV